MRSVLVTLAFLSLPAANPLFAQNSTTPETAMQQRTMSVDDLFAFRRIGAPSLDPTGMWVAWAATEITDSRNNKSVSQIWVASVDGQQPPRQLTSAVAKDSNPRWSPDGRWILFESGRSGAGQLWAISALGGEARQMTSLSTGASGGVWSRDGKRILFTSAVFPEFSHLPFAESDAKNREKTAAAEASPVGSGVSRVPAPLGFTRRRWCGPPLGLQPQNAGQCEGQG